MNSQELGKERLTRLRSVVCALSEPDLISIFKVTTINSFLSQKKIPERNQFFVYGLHFPTTAHFSSFVNNFLKNEKKEKIEVQYKIRLSMFDIYRQMDIHVQISIPGSLQVKGYNLTGQPVTVSGKDYQRGYFSSILRSLYMTNHHPSTKYFNTIEKFEVLKPFIESFVSFSVNQSLEFSSSNFQQNSYDVIYILSEYLIKNRLWKLCQILLSSLQKHFPEKALLFKLQYLLKRKQYKSVIIQTASRLSQSSQPQIKNKLKQFQIQALFRESKSYEVKLLSQYLVHEGVSDLETWKVILHSYHEDNKDKTLMKLINTAYNFLDENHEIENSIEAILELPKNRVFEILEEAKSEKISDFPEYCYRFDNDYLNSHPKVNTFKNVMEKGKKEKTIFDFIFKIDQCLKQKIPLFDILIMFQKHRGWNQLIKIRNQCFWLETDFAAYSATLKQNQKQSDKSFRSLNQSITSMGQTRYEVKEEVEDEIQGVNQSFEGDFSDTQSNQDKQINEMAPCSKRMAVTKRFQPEKTFTKSGQNKVLCHYVFQKAFILIYQSLKLQIQLDKYVAKLNMNKLEEIPKHKRQLLAILLLKKGFLHKKLQRYRKCEESFKLARKCSASLLIGLISCYSLAILYKENNNMKGVQFYMVDLIKILWSVGVKEYDMIPEWGKETIPFIVEHNGKQVIKKLNGPLKQIVELWLNLAEKQ